MNQIAALREGGVFFKQWLRAPKEMGSVLPSSKALARAVANEVAWQPGQHVVELGGGTGSITQGMIDRGIPADRLVVVEYASDLFDYLRERFPKSRVVQGDATRLDEILRHLQVNDVGTVVSGLPMVGMPHDFREAVVRQCFKAVGHGGRVLQYSYSPVSPVRARNLGIESRIATFVPLNVPPAFVWKYNQI